MTEPGIAVLILQESNTRKLVSKLIELKDPVSKGLAGQYFVAYTLLEDLKSIVSHGREGQSDIELSGKGEAVLAELISQISNTTLRFEQLQTRYLEVKTFNWSYEKYRSAIQSYRSRKQAPDLFIGLSLLLRSSKNVEQRTIFNKISEGYLVGVICFMEAASTKESTRKTWDELNRLIQEQYPDSEFDELNLDAVLAVLSFKEQQLQKQEIEELKTEIGLLKQENKEISKMIKQILALLQSE